MVSSYFTAICLHASLYANVCVLLCVIISWVLVFVFKSRFCSRLVVDLRQKCLRVRCLCGTAVLQVVNCGNRSLWSNSLGWVSRLLLRAASRAFLSFALSPDSFQLLNCLCNKRVGEGLFRRQTVLYLPLYAFLQGPLNFYLLTSTKSTKSRS